MIQPHLHRMLRMDISPWREEDSPPSIHWICPVLSQQLIKGSHTPPGPQSASVLQVPPQPQRQLLWFLIGSLCAACGRSSGESALLRERSGCNVVLITASGFETVWLLETDVDVAVAAIAKILASTRTVSSVEIGLMAVSFGRPKRFFAANSNSSSILVTSNSISPPGVGSSILPPRNSGAALQ